MAVHRLPAGLLSKAKPVPLVVIPSGDTSSMQRMTNFNQAADRGGFVVVYPQIVKSYNDIAHAQVRLQRIRTPTCSISPT